MQVLDSITNISVDIPDHLFGRKITKDRKKCSDLISLKDLESKSKSEYWSEAKKQYASLKYRNKARKCVNKDVSASCLKAISRQSEFVSENLNISSNFSHEEQTKIFELGSDISASINKIDLMDTNQIKSMSQNEIDHMFKIRSNSIKKIEKGKNIESFIKKKIESWIKRKVCFIIIKYRSFKNESISKIYKEIISKLANNETKQQKIHWLILSPFISVSMILDFAGIQMLHLNKQVEEWLKAQVNKINSEIDEWLRTQAEFIRIYKDIEESSLIKEQSIEETKTSTFDIPKRQRKNVYSKYVKGFDKSIVKRPERIFSESDRSFKSDRLIQKVKIPALMTGIWSLIMITKQRSIKYCISDTRIVFSMIK